MSENSVIFRILRFKPGVIDPAGFQAFSLSARTGMTVLEGLEEIRLTQDATLMFRYCCHHASCGTCACTINGTPALACTTRIADLKTEVITLEPLRNFACMGDLVVDADGLFKHIPAKWTNLRTCENASVKRRPHGIDQLLRFENCIECGCCMAVCPVVPAQTEFVGPAALAALSSEMRNRPANRQALLDIAAGPGGADLCRRHLGCSRVCPSEVYPARHIADLKRAIQKSEREP
jgi:succinate dehydrogenase / fumarate reductase iron-sulfur subunit